MLIYALIKAGEGDTQDVFISDDYHKLREKIFHIDPSDLSTSLTPADKDALLLMLARDEDYKVGRHVLKNIAPIWEEWTLIIEDI